jgi:hypothetical protein
MSKEKGKGEGKRKKKPAKDIFTKYMVQEVLETGKGYIHELYHIRGSKYIKEVISHVSIHIFQDSQQHFSFKK